MAIVYHIAEVTKVYRGSASRANDQLTIDIQEGEIFGLLGPNGAGKSTLVNQLAGLLRPTAGRIALFGMDVVQRPAVVADYVALQPQHATALQELFPEEAIFHTARFRGMSAPDARRQTDNLMAELGLDPLRRRQIRNLSGGQRKLVTLAVAFVADRPVQIFDEPTNELDPEIRRLIWRKLLEQNKRGATIILVTHNVFEAERVIQRVGIINHGRLMALGTPGELKERVDRRVRLDLLFKSDANGHQPLLEEIGEAHAVSRQHWTVLCARDRVSQTVDHVLQRIGLDELDDFRILTPTLEDVYLQLGGGQGLDAA